MNEQTLVRMDGLAPFWISVKESEMDRTSPRNVHEFHVHPECEIYINLSGDVSFAVEDMIYPIVPGSVIITEPYEYHHCAYHSDAIHRHIWILFSTAGNESFFEPFFQTKSKNGNLRMLSGEQLRTVTSLCRKLQQEHLTEFDKVQLFFRLLWYLEEAETPERLGDGCPESLTLALNYITQHLAEPIRISELADVAHISVNTLERQFLEYLNMAPSRYLRRKRLANAARCLSAGSSVMKACSDSGFSDYSNFISLFRQNFGITPLQYRKQHYQG